MDRGAWRATVHGVVKRNRTSRLSMPAFENGGRPVVPAALSQAGGSLGTRKGLAPEGLHTRVCVHARAEACVGITVAVTGDGNKGI